MRNIENSFPIRTLIGRPEKVSHQCLKFDLFSSNLVPICPQFHEIHVSITQMCHHANADAGWVPTKSIMTPSCLVGEGGDITIDYFPLNILILDCTWISKHQIACGKQHIQKLVSKYEKKILERTLTALT